MFDEILIVAILLILLMFFISDKIRDNCVHMEQSRVRKGNNAKINVILLVCGIADAYFFYYWTT